LEQKKTSSVRCVPCRQRFEVELGAKKAQCPNCDRQYNVSWPWPGEARIETSEGEWILRKDK